MKFKRTTMVILSFIFVSHITATSYSQDRYRKTPYDSEGPFYPVERRADEDNNLIDIQGKSQAAKGDVLHLTGVVVSPDGMPHKDVTVEIWQTDANGLYLHPRDRSGGKRDPFFQYWGTARTDKEGKYSFKTLIPGKYEPRPPHIHFKVWEDGKAVLTSQMYIVASSDDASRINRLLQLEVKEMRAGEFSGHFRIVY